VDDEVYHAARVAAARRKTSVSAFVREALTGLAGKRKPTPLAEEVEQEQRLRLVTLLEQCQLDLTKRPTRQATYARRRFH
jgi:plasmid stability protein